MDSTLQEAFDRWEASFNALCRYLNDATTPTPASTPATTAGDVTEPVTPSSVTTEFVLASAGLAEPPAPAPSIVTPPVVAPATPIDIAAVVPVTFSTECAAQAVTVSTSATNAVPSSVAPAFSLKAGARDDPTPSSTAPIRCSTYCSTGGSMASSQPTQVGVPETLVITTDIVNEAHSLDQGTSAPDLAPTPAALTPTMKAATSCIPMSPTRCSMGGLDHNTDMDDPMASCLLPGSAPTPSPRPWLEPVPPRPPDPTLQHDDYATRVSPVFAPSVTNTADVNTATAVMNSNISVLGNSVSISSVARADVQCANFEVQFDSETFRLMIFFFNAYIYSSNKCLPTTLVVAPIVSEPETIFLVELELSQAGYVLFCGQFRDNFVAALLKNLLFFHSMIDVAENITLLRLLHPATRPWSELFGNMYLSESGNLLYNKQTDLAPSDSQVSVVELDLSACVLEVEVTHEDNLLRGQVSFATTILSFAWANLICFPNSEMCALLAGLLLNGTRIKSEMSNRDIRTHAADSGENKIPYLGRCLGMPLSVIEVSRHVLALGDAYTAEFNANTPVRVALFMTEVPVIIDPELWGQSGNTIRFIWSSRLMDLISGNENCAQVLRHSPQLHRDSGKNKRPHVPCLSNNEVEQQKHGTIWEPRPPWSPHGSQLIQARVPEALVVTSTSSSSSTTDDVSEVVHDAHSGHQGSDSRKYLHSTALTAVVMFELQQTAHLGGSDFIQDELQWKLTGHILHMGSCVAVPYMDDKQLPWDPGDSLSTPAAHVLMLMALNNVGAFIGTRRVYMAAAITSKLQPEPFKEGGMLQLWPPLSSKPLLATSTSSDFDQVHVSYDYYLDHAYYFDTVCSDIIYYQEDSRGDSNKTKEVRIPWDPGEVSPSNSAEASAWGQAEFQGGRDVRNLTRRTPHCADMGSQ